MIVYVECPTLALGGGYVREDKRRELAFPALAPDAVNVLHAGVDLAVGIIRQQRVDQPLVQAQLAPVAGVG